MDVYLLAPIVGFLYNRRSPVDKGASTTKIFTDILLKYQKELEFNYRLIMLLDEEHEADLKNVSIRRFVIMEIKRLLLTSKDMKNMSEGASMSCMKTDAKRLYAG